MQNITVLSKIWEVACLKVEVLKWPAIGCASGGAYGSLFFFIVGHPLWNHVKVTYINLSGFRARSWAWVAWLAGCGMPPLTNTGARTVERAERAECAQNRGAEVARLSWPLSQKMPSDYPPLQMATPSWTSLVKNLPQPDLLRHPGCSCSKTFSTWQVGIVVGVLGYDISNSVTVWFVGPCLFRNGHSVTS